MEYIELIVGLILLVVGGDYLVEGCVDIARKFKISTFIIGMTIVAFGTSAPEFLVSLEAAIKGCSEISLGNVIGSNIANIALILGVTATIYPLTIKQTSAKVDMPFLIVCSAALILTMIGDMIANWEGLILITALLIYIIASIRKDRKQVKDKFEEPSRSLWLAILITIVSCIALAYGSDLLIEGASKIAKNMGVSERIISITIIAFGTSLPELAASVSAAIKKETDIAIGNIIGSNIFNILFVIGMSAVIHPIDNFDFSTFRGDLVWMMSITAALWIFMLPISRKITGKEHNNGSYSKLGRTSGIILLTAYVVYIALLIIQK